MSGDTPHKPKMAPKSDTPPGLEVDGRGNIIPFEERTEGDKQKVRDNIAASFHGEHSIKNPDNEAEIPAPMRPSSAGIHEAAAVPNDPTGQQGGTKGTGRG